MTVQIIEETERKRKIIEKCDGVFLRPITPRDDYEEIFSRIDRNALFFSAVEGNEDIGYAAIYVDDHVSKAGYITMIGVVREMQGRHVGSALMHSCLAAAAEHGMTCVRLEVMKKNTRAIAVYEHWGFAYERDCSEESIYMVRHLAQAETEKAGER